MSNTPYYIFLVDDDQDDKDLFTEALNECTIKTEVVSFDNGKDLMGHLEDGSNRLPQIIFLDLNMPIMNGEACLSKIRENKRLGTIPVVIYSTTFVLKIANRLKSQGANLYIQKPSSYTLLKSILERSINAVLENKEDLKIVSK